MPCSPLSFFCKNILFLINERNRNVSYYRKKIDNPKTTETDSMLGECSKDCHNNYFQKLKFECRYDIKLTNITSIEIFFLTITGESINLYDLNKSLKVARQNRFVFNQINKLIIKVYSHLLHIIIKYYPKNQIPMCRGLFFKVISHYREHMRSFCSDMENPVHFACPKWFNQSH